ncbi:hypothetical protein D1007_32338 [Hordeum vulgare]|nr:hypothetical protein D1007_32338 [Hordeum vulgare]
MVRLAVSPRARPRLKTMSAGGLTRFRCRHHSSPSSSLPREEGLLVPLKLFSQQPRRALELPYSLIKNKLSAILLKRKTCLSHRLWALAKLFHMRPRNGIRGPVRSATTGTAQLPQPCMRSHRVGDPSPSVASAKTPGSRRRDGMGPRNWTRNSIEFLLTWYATGSSLEEGGGAGVALRLPRPPHSRRPRPSPFLRHTRSGRLPPRPPQKLWHDPNGILSPPWRPTVADPIP